MPGGQLALFTSTFRKLETHSGCKFSQWLICSGEVPQELYEEAVTKWAASCFYINLKMSEVAHWLHESLKEL